MSKDHHGHTLTGASSTAAAHYAQALDAYHCLNGDPATPLMAALEDSPGFAMGHVLMGYMCLVFEAKETTAAAMASVAAAKSLTGLTAREQAHVAAVSAVADGELTRAGRILEDLSIEYPHDVVALQFGQSIDYLRGDARMLRDRISRGLRHWSKDRPDYHAVLGMLAFGLEESGLYARAEAAGREAIALQPRNNWAQHAVAHVLEMQDRRADGVRWMRHENTVWQENALLGVHNWWHTALFHLGLGETDEVLAIYDRKVMPQPTTRPFDLIDAAAMLWRLKLLGANVGDRWGAVADGYAAEPAGLNAFSDVHAMMAFAATGRAKDAEMLIASQKVAAKGPGDNAMFARDVGLPVAQGFWAFADGKHGQAVELLRGVRNHAARFGGSHAQRDIIDLTLIAAARGAGEAGLEQALLSERANASPAAERAIALAA